MKKLFLLPLLTLISLTGQAQIVTTNVGYQDDPGTITIGMLYENLDVDILGSVGSDNGDSETTLGLKLGYMFYLHRNNSTAVYLGPQVGYYGAENYTQDTSSGGLLYGAGAGVFLDPFNLAVGYGLNEVTETEYLSFKVGFNIMFL